MAQNLIRRLSTKSNAEAALSAEEASHAGDIEEFLHKNEQASLLRFSTAGSVDDGKSTLIGRLLHDSKNLFEDQLALLNGSSESVKPGLTTEACGSLALITDGLKAEREQGITIDVAYRHFATPKRRFILGDTPGHEQYTRNMATGSSNADLSIILIDARKGILPQTKRHLFIASLLGVPSFIAAINKMDLVDYSEQVFQKIKKEILEFADKLGITDIEAIPVSALQGDNIVEGSSAMPWYQGATLLKYLEEVDVDRRPEEEKFRFPVQYSIFSNGDYRAYAGQIASGSIHVGDEIVALPSFKKSKIKSIEVSSPGLKQSMAIAAHAPLSVSLTLSEELDVGRGDMIVKSADLPQSKSHFEAMLVWMGDEPMNPNRFYILRHTTTETKAYVEKVNYKFDIETLGSLPAETLHMNEVGQISVNTTNPLFFDSYKENRVTGSFIMIDPKSYQTVAAGMILEQGREDSASKLRHEMLKAPRHMSKNIHQEKSAIEMREREERTGHRACTVWFTGLSGSGKSSIAKGLERTLFEEGINIYRLDGDNLRLGLNRDLGFSEEERIENIRRAAEVARLFNEAGTSVLCAFISPFERDRKMAADIIGRDRFIEIFVDTPISVCEQRDPHGLYKRARAGDIAEFTGVSSPYEDPLEPDLRIDTSRKSLEDCVCEVNAAIRPFLFPAYLKAKKDSSPA